MDYFNFYLKSLPVLLLLLTMLWLYSVKIKDAGIVDIFWGFGFVVSAWVFYFYTAELGLRAHLLLALVTIWGLRLTIHIGIRNIGKEEDYRYQQFRKNYGVERYWWVSFFQVFLLQGILMWLVSAPLAAVFYYANSTTTLSLLDFVALILWIVGFAFEAGGDLQLARFKSKPSNKGKLLEKGFWKYTRHPNYFGDAAIWWAYGLFSIAAGSYWPFLGSILMTFLLVRVSGVRLLERDLKANKSGYVDYVRRTSAFIPWFPKK